MTHDLEEQEWIGVDFDRTLAHYDHFRGIHRLGPPVPRMQERVKEWLEQGRRVKIFTARVDDDPIGSIAAVMRLWCREHLGQELEITNIKDRYMVELWDDRAIQVVPNTGEPVPGSLRKVDDRA